MRWRVVRSLARVAGLLAWLAVPTVVTAAPAPPQVDPVFLGDFQEQFNKDEGNVRVVLLLAPS